MGEEGCIREEGKEGGGGGYSMSLYYCTSLPVYNLVCMHFEYYSDLVFRVNNN